MEEKKAKEKEKDTWRIIVLEKRRKKINSELKMLRSKWGLGKVRLTNSDQVLEA